MHVLYVEVYNIKGEIALKIVKRKTEAQHLFVQIVLEDTGEKIVKVLLQEILREVVGVILEATWEAMKCH